MSRVVDRLPAVVEIDEKIEQLRQQERRVLSKLADQRARYHAAVATWERRAVEAETAGTDAPERPEPPDDHVRGIVLGNFRNELAAAQRARLAAVASAAPEIAEEVYGIVSDILAAAKPHLSALGDLLADLRDGLGALDEVRGARMMLDPSGRREDRPPREVDLSSLAHAVEHGPATLTDGRADPPRRLGLIVATSAISDAAPEPEPRPNISTSRHSPGARP